MSELEEENQGEVRRQRRALWISISILVVALVISAALRLGKSSGESVAADAPTPSSLAAARLARSTRVKVVPANLVEVAKESGLQWRHVSGATGKKYFPESMGTGVAWIDWDNDLDPDLVFVNATAWPEDSSTGKVGYLAAFENDGRGNFHDVTEKLGLKRSLYGTGLAIGDFDGNGFCDLYVTAYGKNLLFRNVDGRRFEDVTEAWGVAGETGDYSTSAAFFDADSDGDLDLLVGNYSEWSPEINRQLSQEIPGYGPIYNDPEEMSGQFGRLYQNDGTRFTDRSAAWGIQVVEPSTGNPVGKNLGFGFGYFNEDRTMDIVVANDRVRNLFFTSKAGDGFEEKALETGFAYDRRGKPSAAMGIDVDRDMTSGDYRVVMGNFFEEMTSLYVGKPRGSQFVDESVAEGIGPRTNNRVTFGALFADYDLDGFQDVLQVNGAIDNVPPLLMAVGIPYKQPGDIFWNCRGQCGTTYVYLGKKFSSDFARPIVGRGLAAADMDGDGDLDFVATGVDAPPYLYRNDTETAHRWLRVKLRGKKPNPDAIGAEVIVRTGEHAQYRLVQPSRSYFSANELIQTFGLGAWSEPVDVEVVWPSGASQSYVVKASNRVVTLRESEVSEAQIELD